MEAPQNAKVRFTYGTPRSRPVPSSVAEQPVTESCLVSEPCLATEPSRYRASNSNRSRSPTARHYTTNRSRSPSKRRHSTNNRSRSPTKRQLIQKPLSFASPHKPTNTSTKALRLPLARPPGLSTHLDKVQTNPRKTQAFLDFGQRPIAPEPCSTCGMAYQRGRDEDEQLHRRHHRAWQQRQSRVLLWDIDASNDDDAFMSVAYYDRGLAAKPAGRTRASIRIVDPHVASKREVSRALDILNHVNVQLGACLLTLDELLQRQRKVFVYVSPARRVEGCVLAEIIRGAHRVLPASSVHDGVVCGSEQVPAVCGISRVWVASDARRHGVARQMFDAVRERFAYGCHIGRDQIAFTQPTADGRALAESLFQRKDFLVYVED